MLAQIARALPPDDQGDFLLRTESGWRELLESTGFDVEESHEDLGSFSNVVLVCRRQHDAIPAAKDSAGSAVSR